MGGMFYMGTNDQIMQGGGKVSLAEVESSSVPSRWSWLDPQIGDWIKKAPSAHYTSWVGDCLQSLSSFLKNCLVGTCSFMSWL